MSVCIIEDVLVYLQRQHVGLMTGQAPFTGFALQCYVNLMRQMYTEEKAGQICSVCVCM